MLKKLFSLKFWLPVLVLGLGAGITFALLKNKPKARKKPNFQRGTLVEVLEATLSNPQIEIRTHGRVRAAKKIILSARVGGEVIWISKNLHEGRFFKKGEMLLSVGIRQSQSRLKAPFDGVVQTKNVDLGQFVNPGMQLATLLGSNQAEVVIDLPMGRMDWLPQMSASGKNKNRYQIPAIVSLSGMNSAASWSANVNRHLPELTPRGMMVQLLAAVNDPFRLKEPERRGRNVSPLKKKSSGAVQTRPEVQLQNIGNKPFATTHTENKIIPEKTKMPLFVGAFVDVKIPGRKLENVVKIPAQALRDQDTVWIAMENELQVRRVQIAHIDLDNVFLAGGVNAGEQIIISPIKGASNGLKIRIAGKKKENRKQSDGIRSKKRRGRGKGEDSVRRQRKP